MLIPLFKVRGLCGTLTWNQHDDFTTPEGDVENSVSLFAGKFTTEHCALPRGAPPDPCATYTQRRQYAETVCSVIHSTIFQVVCCMWSVKTPDFSARQSSLPISLSLSFIHISVICFCRCVMTWWRGSPISVSACRRFVHALHRGHVTAPSLPPTPDNAHRRVYPSTGATRPSAVSVETSG